MIDLTFTDEFDAKLLIAGDKDGLEVRAEDAPAQANVDISADDVRKLYEALREEYGDSELSATNPQGEVEVTVRIKR